MIFLSNITGSNGIATTDQSAQYQLKKGQLQQTSVKELSYKTPEISRILCRNDFVQEKGIGEGKQSTFLIQKDCPRIIDTRSAFLQICYYNPWQNR